MMFELHKNKVNTLVKLCEVISGNSMGLTGMLATVLIIIQQKKD